jgi:tetratricopeptide (TPR) repeat protein
MRKRTRFWVYIAGCMMIASLSGWTLANRSSLQQEPSLTPAQKVERVLRLCQSKQYEAAKAIAEALVQSPLEYGQLTGEEQIALHRCLALVYNVEGRVDLADEQLRKAQEIRQRLLTPPSPPPPPPPPPPTPAQKVQRVVALCRQKLFDAAQPIAENLLQTESEYQSLDDFDKTTLHYCLAQIYSAQGRSDKAEEQIKQVQAIRQARAATISRTETLADRVREVLTLCELANFPEAKPIAEAALQDPDYASLTPSDKVALHRCLAQIYAAEGDNERVIEQFRQILKINPRFALKDPSSPLSDVTSPQIEKLFDSAKPKPSSAALTLGGLGLAALIASLRQGSTPGEPDPNQFTFRITPQEITANGDQSATAILQVRDNFGRLVTNDSETQVDISIPNEGGNYEITIETVKGETISPPPDPKSTEIRGKYRVSAGELILNIKVLAPVGAPPGSRRTFDVVAKATPPSGQGTILQSSLITLAPAYQTIEIPLYMSAGNTQDSVIAVITNAPRTELFSKPKENPQGNYIAIKEGDTLYEKLAKKADNTIQWTVKVQASDSNITLWWVQDLLPSDYNFELLDTVSGRRINMKTDEPSFILTAGSRELILTATKARGRSASTRRSASERVLITGLTARGTRGGQIVVSFGLNRPAQVRATLRTMNGQTLTQLPARNATRGLNTLMLWDEQLGKTPPGTYLLEIEAIGEDGTLTRAAIPVLLTR